MPLEIERKFLVDSTEYKLGAKAIEITQAYLAVEKNLAVRVRIEGVRASITIKSKKSERVNLEYEYSIPLDEAKSMMILSPFPAIEKTRHTLEHEGHTWEVDEFYGENKGLVVAEIELDEENEQFEKPHWLGEEVTGDFRYLNSNLAKMPIQKW